MNRRGFLGAILAAGVAPAVARIESLMHMVPTESGLLVPEYLGIDEGCEDATAFGLHRIRKGDTFIVRTWYIRGDGVLTCADTRVPLDEFGRIAGRT